MLVSDNPMTPDGVKTTESDKNVTRNFVHAHVDIGIAALQMIIQEKKTVKHMKFDW
jgi:AMP nucleosidase